MRGVGPGPAPRTRRNMAEEYKFENLKKLADIDMVNRPPHYNREGAMQCIDEMIMVFGKEAVKNFCLCNAWKYRYRAADKNGEEDIKKSDWYLAKYKELDDKVKYYTTTNITVDPLKQNNFNPQIFYGDVLNSIPCNDDGQE